MNSYIIKRSVQLQYHLLMIQEILIIKKFLEKQISLLIHYLFIKKNFKVWGVVENISF